MQQFLVEAKLLQVQQPVLNYYEKKAQKKEKKNKISERINKIIPYLIPCLTIKEW